MPYTDIGSKVDADAGSVDIASPVDGDLDAVKVTLAGQIAGEDLDAGRMRVEHAYSPSYISSATTTVVKTGAGFLRSITVTETAAGAITVYDNTAGSGTVIAVLKASIGERTYTFDVAFTTGLTIVTAAASKITVAYR